MCDDLGLSTLSYNMWRGEVSDGIANVNLLKTFSADSSMAKWEKRSQMGIAEGNSNGQ